VSHPTVDESETTDNASSEISASAPASPPAAIDGTTERRTTDNPADPPDLEEGPGGEADLGEGPAVSVILEPSVASLKAEILEKVAAYARRRWAPQPYVPGKTPAPYAGRVFDEEEVVNLVDASLDFWLTSGRFCRQLEQGLAKFVGVAECRLVNSGSSANLLAFSTLTSPRLGERRIRPGDEVLTVAAGFPTTVAPVVQHGVIPVFVDVDQATDNIDPSQLNDALGPRTRAVMVAHTLGNPFDLDAVLDFCEANGLWLIEDNCDGMGSEYTSLRGSNELTRRTGSFGHIATSSFYPAHQMTTGEGGAVYTNDDELAAIAESIRDWGRDCYCQPGRSNTCGKRFGWSLGTLPEGYDHKYTYSHFGYNLKMTDMQAAVGVSQLKKLPTFVAARRSNFDAFHQRLARFGDVLRLPQATPRSTPSWFGFLIVVLPGSGVTRDSLVEALEKARVQTRMLFAGNIVRQPCFDEMRDSGTGFRIIGDLTNTDRLMNDAFWFGVYPGMTEAHVDHICSTIELHLAEHGAI
jgi:CDP-6-deoxy-D-xylo-4-hexulose-3-dehydrase